MRRLGLLMLLACWGCESPGVIEVQPDKQILLSGKGSTVQLQATVKTKEGKPLPGARVTFKSMTPTMATVDPEGTVRAVSSGASTILVTAGDARREVEVLVQVPKKIQIDPESPMLMLGVTRRFKATVINDRDQPMIAGEVSWTTSDPAIFTVDRFGDVKTLAEGRAALTVFAAGIKGSTEITVKHEELQDDGTLTQ